MIFWGRLATAVKVRKWGWIETVPEKMWRISPRVSPSRRGAGPGAGQGVVVGPQIFRVEILPVCLHGDAPGFASLIQDLLVGKAEKSLRMP